MELATSPAGAVMVRPRLVRFANANRRRASSHDDGWDRPQRARRPPQEMIAFIAGHIMDLEVEGLTGASHREGSPTRINQRERIVRTIMA